MKLTRQLLHVWVWQTPITRVAEVLGISESGLHKVTDRFDVPTPPRGYWTLRKYKKPTHIIPLPNPGDIRFTSVDVDAGQVAALTEAAQASVGVATPVPPTPQQAQNPSVVPDVPGASPPDAMGPSAARHNVAVNRTTPPPGGPEPATFHHAAAACGVHATCVMPAGATEDALPHPAEVGGSTLAAAALSSTTKGSSVSLPDPGEVLALADDFERCEAARRMLLSMEARAASSDPGQRALTLAWIRCARAALAAVDPVARLCASSVEADCEAR
jgi:hypothetical protein